MGKSIPFLLFAGLMGLATLAHGGITRQSMTVGKHKFTVIAAGSTTPKAAAFVFFNNASERIAPDPSPLLDYLAGQGVKVLSVEYLKPLPTIGKRTPELLAGTIRDTKAALLAIRQDAGKLGIDPHRIVAAGLGDGGYFALATAVIKDFNPEGQPGDWMPNAIVGLSPLLYETGDLPAVLGGSAFYQELGGTLPAFQPARHVSAGAPPTLLLGMERHPHTSTEELARFKVAADKAGNRCEVTVYFKVPFRNYFKYHDFNQHVQYTVHSFLQSLGYIAAKPAFDAPRLATSKELRAAKEGYAVHDIAKKIAVMADPDFGSAEDVDISQIVYRQHEQAPLHLLVFRKKGAPASRPLPAFVYIHGGGWRGGHYYDWLGFAKDIAYLTRRGMVGFSVEYRTFQYGKAEPPEGLKDCKAAIRYIRQHAKELGVDPDRIVAAGASAGGHLAAASGTVKGFEHPDQDLSVSSRPNALVLHSPVMDNGPWAYGYERVNSIYPAFSPINNLTRDTPPTLEFSGVTEAIVPKDSMAYLKRKIDSLGVYCDINVMIRGGHAQTNPCANSPLIAKYLMWKTDKFLAQAGYLQGTPAIDIAKFEKSPWLEVWDWKTSPYGLDYLEVMQQKAKKGSFRTRRPAAAAAALDE